MKSTWRHASRGAVVAMSLLGGFSAPAGYPALLAAHASATEATPARTEAPAAGRYFSARSPWNTPIPEKPPLASGSGALAAKLRQFDGFQLNQGSWTVNVSIPPPDTPRQVVTQEGLLSREEIVAHEAQGFSQWVTTDVPVAEDAFGTPDSDAHLVIVDRAFNRVFNFYGTRRDAAGRLRAYGQGVFRLDGPGWWDPSGGTSPGPWTGRSSNSSLLAGLIFPEELKAGAIPHALAIGVDENVTQPMQDGVAAPATTFDMHTSGTVPGGTRIQLDPALDLDSLKLGREAKIIARALQTYGAFVVESTTGLALYFRSTSNLGSDPYAMMNFTGIRTGDAAFKTIKNGLRVIRPEPSYEYDYPSRWSPANPRKDPP